MSEPRCWFPELRPADERTALEQFLDQYRHIVTSKLADDQAHASAHVLPATDLTLGGLVKHLAWAEDRWFQGKLLGLELPEPWASAPLAEDPDWPFHSSRHDSVDEVLSLYSSACARSRAAADPFRFPRCRRRGPFVREGSRQPPVDLRAHDRRDRSPRRPPRPVARRHRPWSVELAAGYCGGGV
jgi:Protein of unknown function (DUF664)